MKLADFHRNDRTIFFESKHSKKEENTKKSNFTKKSGKNFKNKVRVKNNENYDF